MFKEARVKLTLYYLTIIMVISLFFSLIIYKGMTSELDRIETRQRMMRPDAMFMIDPELVIETKTRIFFSLLTLNVVILLFSGVSGYFLAGKTLEPISKMMNEQKEFVGNASHELRTPLASLKSQIEVALRSKKMHLNEFREVLQSNLDDVNNMTNLSNYLLKLNRLQNIKSEFKKVRLDKVARVAIGKSKIKTIFKKTEVVGDGDSLKELVSILIDNAIKYGNNKEITMEIKDKTLKIVDNGIGISKNDLPHIFDRFYRGDKARSHDGYGLGLSIAKQIVDNHKAKIKVESKLGFGTTFKVIFS